ncbi:arsenate reductase/protein-tyrosine-phosphatase family protein [Limnoglobus roseus]|uniref:protein-tyrosine-phosphatase n=1 Tax=Limnoglobus roseus TaxID=2598579 RepID=A0A5C1AD04_9BACT|nr:low molecular weight phosphatase family protein [Limnoglobus roseus]QEL16093.1 protein tyrosine phosphatase [Limnoglobus roseus]
MSSHANNSSWPPDQPLRRSVLFVCTGNTCRSPLAEGLCKKLLADRLGITPEELPARGYTIRSAGVSAYPGDVASPEGVAIAAGYGVDLSQHRSRPVNPELLADATDVVTMTAGHAAVLMIRYPGYGPEPVLLSEDEDVPDPIGGDRTDYESCALMIVKHLNHMIAEWTRI